MASCVCLQYDSVGGYPPSESLYLTNTHTHYYASITWWKVTYIHIDDLYQISYLLLWLVAEDVNLALNRPAWQSSNQNNQSLAENAVDGDEDTYAKTSTQYRPYLGIDLGAEINVTSIYYKRQGSGKPEQI